MKYINLIKSGMLLAFFATAFSACDKVNEVEPVGDGGQTLVKILGGGGGASGAGVPGATPAKKVSSPIDFVSTPTQILAIQVRRDIANNTDLNKAMQVTVKDDTAAVTAAGLKQFPLAWFTVQTDAVKVGGQGGTWTFTLQPGQASALLYVTIPNATLLDPSSLYGFGYTILTADADGVISTQKAVVIEVGAKNPYDGVYSYETGLVTRYTAPGVPAGDALSGPLGPANPDVFLVTVGAYTVAVPPAGTAGTFTWSGGTSGVAGIDGFRIVVDPATNLTTESSSANATLTNWAGKVNKYDPLTKTMTLGFRWNPTANVREYEVILKYKRSR